MSCFIHVYIEEKLPFRATESLKSYDRKSTEALQFPKLKLVY